MNYLIVDDSPTMRRIVMNALTSIGYTNFTEAGDGAEALTKLNSTKIDFVITDWNIPVMNGLELITNIRNNEKFQNLPILMITTKGNREDIMLALKARVNNYIVKPFTPNVLKEKINQVLNIKE